MEALQKMKTARERRRPFSFSGAGGSLPLRPDDDLALDLAMLIEGETSGQPLEDVLEKFGRSRTAYYEKLRRFRDEGARGLIARPPGPHGPWRRSHDVVRFVVTARLRDPGRSPEVIARDLASLGHDVSVRSVERTLQQFGLTRAKTRRAPLAAAPGPATATAPQTDAPAEAVAQAPQPALQVASPEPMGPPLEGLAVADAAPRVEAR